MTQRTRADDHSNGTESDFYLPGSNTPASDGGRVERLWASLFNHQVGPGN